MNSLPPAIERYIVAYNNRDVEGMIGTLADDVVFINRSGGDVSAEIQGKLEFSELAKTSIEAFSDRKQVVSHAITVANVTVAEIEFRATVATNLPNGWTKGQLLSFSGRSLFRVENGKIAQIIDES